MKTNNFFLGHFFISITNNIPVLLSLFSGIPQSILLLSVVFILMAVRCLRMKSTFGQAALHWKRWPQRHHHQGVCSLQTPDFLLQMISVVCVCVTFFLSACSYSPPPILLQTKSTLSFTRISAVPSSLVSSFLPLPHFNDQLLCNKLPQT